MKNLFAVVCFLILSLSTSAVAQKFDAGLTLGASSVSDAHLTGNCPLGVSCLAVPPETASTSHQIFVEGAPAFRLADAKIVSVHVELPIAGIRHQNITFNQAGTNQGSGHVSSLYITPSIRTSFLPGAPVSPWLSLGGGLARFFLPLDRPDKLALQIGAGADFKTPLPHLGFRLEVRDFLSGQPTFGIAGVGLAGNPESGLSRHNVLAGGGFVLHF